MSTLGQPWNPVLALKGSCLTGVSEGVWGERDQGGPAPAMLVVPRALSGPSSPSVAVTLGGLSPPPAWQGPRFRALATSHWGLENAAAPQMAAAAWATNR